MWSKSAAWSVRTSGPAELAPWRRCSGSMAPDRKVRENLDG
ncbi:hypothetical protein RKD19_006877 [Streptomyces canus]